ncbi:uncharacterized protein AMSG_08216 [Thecamonas trahens ATCC 50062]|uniref:Uncharacterized protein n=1 Tax=Thecamonas trahens ATCC 50062 TaxID=461836 RepID=A0A0L0DKT7_THETB|nr:hypothetical protein AMSG_08216 [Thecamonas trahens ATCC 50062]KNC51968.1 hypothetical protein AMSG_08216 [Thecamonas trahens ATCC 50062]|eukprot:XP_013755555.1 hypothetical protein AMSG_08216 [Thecamonas trahens ATCC 50062]
MLASALAASLVAVFVAVVVGTGARYEYGLKPGRPHVFALYSPLRLALGLVATGVAAMAMTAATAAAAMATTQYPLAFPSILYSATPFSFCGPRGWLSVLSLALGASSAALVASAFAPRPLLVPDLLATALLLHALLVTAADRAFPANIAYWVALCGGLAVGAILGTIVNYRIGAMEYRSDVRVPPPRPQLALSLELPSPTPSASPVTANDGDSSASDHSGLAHSRDSSLSLNAIELDLLSPLPPSPPPPPPPPPLTSPSPSRRASTLSNLSVTSAHSAHSAQSARSTSEDSSSSWFAASPSPRGLDVSSTAAAASHAINQDETTAGGPPPPVAGSAAPPPAEAAAVPGSPPLAPAGYHPAPSTRDGPVEYLATYALGPRTAITLAALHPANPDMPPTPFAVCRHIVAVAVLRGAVDVLGATLTSASGWRVVWSQTCHGTAPLQPTAVPDPALISPLPPDPWLDAFPINLPDPDSVAGSIVSDAPTVIAFVPVPHEMLPPYMMTLMRADVTDMDASAGVSAAVMGADPHGPPIACLPGWREAMDGVIADASPPRVLVMGSQGAGKSTFVSLMTNRLLAHHPAVAIVDYDVGQPLLNVPGTVSVTLVGRPLLGPAGIEMHAQLASRAFFAGFVSASKSPTHLVRCIEWAIRALPTLLDDAGLSAADVPVVTNSFGWATSLGLQISSVALGLLHPSAVVYLTANPCEVSFPDHGPPVVRVPSRPVRMVTPPAPLLDAIGIDDLTMPDVPTWWIPPARSVVKRNARARRDERWIGYFGSAGAELAEAVPYRVPLSALHIVSTLHYIPPEHVGKVLLNSLVGLATSPSAADHLGFGIVRGISDDGLDLFIITPVEPRLLNDVNTLLFATSTLPADFIRASTALGRMPFSLADNVAKTKTGGAAMHSAFRRR